MAEAALKRSGPRGPAVVRVAFGHPRLLLAILFGLATYAGFAEILTNPARAIVAWDVGVAAYLVMIASVIGGDHAQRMASDAARQEEGEWVVFGFSVLAILVSFAVIVAEFSSIKAAAPGQKGYHVALVGVTLLLSWLMSQTVFALRYAHEYYTSSDGAGTPDGGLEFPGENWPDYLDFAYFALVLGMTFQVSDVQITSRKFRRVAALHGLLGFLFNTIIIALTVNLASGLLN